MLDLRNYIQIQHNLPCVLLSVIHPMLCPPATRDLFHADKGAQRVCGITPLKMGYRAKQRILT